MKYLLTVILVGFAVLMVTGCNDSKVLEKITAAEVDLSQVTNGVYQGTYTLRLPAGSMVAYPSATVNVTVADHRYQNIAIVSKPMLMSNSSIQVYFKRVIDEQKINIDGISGASYTRKAIQKAIEAAFKTK